jgi:threonine dehydrogenase-like Zn-dependent dehydrogenase
VKKWNDASLPGRLGDLSLILGHEVAGTVVAVGSRGQSDVVVGERVAVDPVIREGSRYFRSAYGDVATEGRLLGVGSSAGDPVANARLFQVHGIGGGFGEMLKIPLSCVIRLPNEVSSEAGSLLEPVADVVRSVGSVGVVRDKLCVVFGLGPMGLLHASVLLDAGARVIGLDPREDRREAARLIGVKDFERRDSGIDVAFVAVGGSAMADAIGQGLGSLRRGGALVLFSSGPHDMELRVNVNQIHYGEHRIVGVVGSMREDYEVAVDVIRRGVVDVSVLRHPRLPFLKLQSAFELVGQLGVQKVGIDFPGGEG